jgi:hypothetical protein
MPPNDPQSLSTSSIRLDKISEEWYYMNCSRVIEPAISNKKPLTGNE